MAKEPEGRKTVRTSDRVEFQILAEVLREMREGADISQRKLGVLIGRDRSYIGKLEGGKIYPDLATVIDIVLYLGGDPGEVVNRVVKETKKKRR